MVVRVSEVAVVEKPDIAHIEDLVIGASEEFGEVLAWLEKVREPDQGREITLSALEELASQLDLISLLLVGCLYIVSFVIAYLN